MGIPSSGKKKQLVILQAESLVCLKCGQLMIDCCLAINRITMSLLPIFSPRNISEKRVKIIEETENGAIKCCLPCMPFTFIARIKVSMMAQSVLKN